MLNFKLPERQAGTTRPGWLSADVDFTLEKKKSSKLHTCEAYIERNTEFIEDSLDALNEVSSLSSVSVSYE